MKSSNFYDFSTRQLGHRSLHHWYQKLQYLSRLSLASNNLLSTFNSTQRHRVLSQWYHDTVLRSKLKDFLDARNLQLKQQMYLHWKIMVIQSRRSKLFFLKTRFHRLLKACKKFRTRQRRLELSEIAVMAFRSSNTQLHVLRHWIICGRGLLFSKFMRTRLLRLRWQRWRRRTAHVHYHLPQQTYKINSLWSPRSTSPVTISSTGSNIITTSRKTTPVLSSFIKCLSFNTHFRLGGLVIRVFDCWN